MKLVKWMMVIGSGVVLGMPGCTYPETIHGLSLYPFPGAPSLWGTLVNAVCGAIPALPGC